MSSTATKTKQPPRVSAFELVRRIEALTGEFPYQIKQLKAQVNDLIKKDKKLGSLRSVADRSAKRADRYESFLKEYAAAYKRCSSAISSASRELEEISTLYLALADYYSKEGKHRDEKRISREGDKFEAAQRRNIEAIKSLLASANEVDVIDFTEDEELDEREEERDIPKAEGSEREYSERARREEQDKRYARAVPPPPYGYAYDPYRMPQYQMQPSINIAPISIDVNRAVDAAMASFVKNFEAKMAEYLAGYSSASNASIPSESAEVLSHISEDSAFVLDHLLSMLENVKALLAGISELEGAYGALEEKIKAHGEAAKALTEAQRTVSRELQGMQVVNKVTLGEMQKLGEAQKALGEEISQLLASHTKLGEEQKAHDGELVNLVERQNELNAMISELLAKQGDIMSEQQQITKGTAKISEQQKSLSDKQAQLTELQREAFTVNKKLIRSQRALNEKLGAKMKPDEPDEEKEQETV